jgi:hypothetical protein
LEHVALTHVPAAALGSQSCCAPLAQATAQRATKWLLEHSKSGER